MKKSNFYLTTTLPYVNAEPHIGFGLEIVTADVICRYMRETGHEVIFNTGTDEHGQKIYEKALENKQDPQAYTDFYAAKFEELKKLFDLSYTHFIRTTNPDHKKSAQEFWRICDQNGYIYKKMYKVKYCVGCELEKQDSDLVDGKCPLHPNKELELREEENYFFKFSAFEQQLLDLYQDRPDFVRPESKYKEIVAFVKGGLQDFSISRLKEKMPWGVEVPNDPGHVMYVWFDALVNYISTLGWPKPDSQFTDFWPGTQIAGKDNLRQQSAMWQAMLLAAKLPPSKQILINGFISIDGQKMSKSLGNVISPTELVSKYSTDGARFLLMYLGPIGTDMDTSWEKLDVAYTANLANGLGNLCSRVAKMAEKASLAGIDTDIPPHDAYVQAMEKFEIKAALDLAIEHISNTDRFLSNTKPWQLTGQKQVDVLTDAVKKIRGAAWLLKPFMPDTAAKILSHFSSERITALSPLFPRI